MRQMSPNDTASVAALLRQCRVFQGLTTDELVTLAARATFVDIPEGTTFITKGQRSNQVYIIQSGIARLSLQGDKRHYVRVFSAADLLGWTALVEPPIALGTVEAAMNVRAWAIPRAALIEIMEENPEAGYEIMKAIASMARSRYADSLNVLGGEHPPELLEA